MLVGVELTSALGFLSAMIYHSPKMKTYQDWSHPSCNAPHHLKET